MIKKKKIKIGISIGDPNGIGPEIILKFLKKENILDFFTPIIFSSMKVLSYYKNLLSLKLELNKINSLKEIQSQKINVIDILYNNFIIKPGKEENKAGKHAKFSLESTIEALKNNYVDIIVTAPLNKKLFYSKNFPFMGHTEYLQSKISGKSLMLMIHNKLKIALLTHHIPLKKVKKQINTFKIIQKIKLLEHSLKKDFNIKKPKIAILGINPHSGDNNLLGNEEEKEILPAIKKLLNENILVYGPYPADSFFGSNKYKKFDATLAMYHDQGLIPFKILTFGEGVNFTAGLSYIRTSPDHGVAYDIAGKGIANENSFKEAVFNGIKIFKNRNYIKN